MTTTIAVLGAGKIGATLTRKWAAAGYTVAIGTRHPDRPEQRALAEETGAFLAAHADAVAALGSALDDRLVIDATNNIGAPVLNSLAAVAEHAPAAVAARAFNSLGWENFADPDFDGTPADLLWCGPDSDNGAVVEGLIADVGLRPVSVGDLDQIHVVDMLVALWSALALGQGRGRHLAFKVLAR